MHGFDVSKTKKIQADVNQDLVVRLKFYIEIMSIFISILTVDN